MPRFALAMAVAVALVLAAAAPAAAPKRTSATGTITALRLHTITIRARHDVTCRIAPRSPRVRGFAVGARASIRCVDGILRALVKAPTPTPPGVYVVLGGSITALSAGSITVGGSVTCSIGERSPSLGGFRVGSAVTGRCDAGVLTSLSHATDA
jgi:hypothetical protein